MPAIEAVGTVVLRVVVALVLDVQPFAPVTVTINVPAVVIALEAAVVEPSDQT